MSLHEDRLGPPACVGIGHGHGHGDASARTCVDPPRVASVDQVAERRWVFLLILLHDRFGDGSFLGRTTHCNEEIPRVVAAVDGRHLMRCEQKHIYCK